jgi:UDP-N-acetylmuramate--alanine ligase
MADNKQQNIVSEIEALSLIPGDTIFFVGIGGIGMSAIARYCNAKGFKVCGYDKTPTNLTNQLQNEGIEIIFEDGVEFVNHQAKLVVYTPAIPASHPQLNFYKDNNFVVAKRSDMLQWITANAYTIAVAGTHGKTTTSSMVAHILRHSGYGCTAFLGGIAANYNTNYWHSSTANGKDVIVVEADEYDRSFLKLNPNVAIITSVDADHLDIYGTPEEVVKAFVDFSKKVAADGCLIVKHNLPCFNDFTTSDICTYDYNNSNANTHISNLLIEEGFYKFDVVHANWVLNNVQLFMGGLHNIENCLAAISVAKYLQLDDDKIIAAIKDYKGVKRRFEYIIKPSFSSTLNSVQQSVLIDDYAHHPQELKALITGVRSLFGTKKITLVFQPHLFSRTQDLALEFAEVLSTVDKVILLPIYPARELPIEGVTSEWLLDKITIANKHCMLKEELLEFVKLQKPELLVMAGAGDIDTLLIPIKTILTTNS